jgi:hypothetical protein
LERGEPLGFRIREILEAGQSRMKSEK